VNFFVAKICHFAGKHSSKQHGQGELFGKFSRKSSHFKKVSHQDLLKIWADF